MPDPTVLSTEVLLTTLVVKIAVMALLAIVLVRYHRFRAILITERRAWPERLTFAVSFGVPLAAGVTARLLLHYDAADLTLEGAYLAGLIAGPQAGALVGVMTAAPAVIAGQWIALPFAVGCGYAGGGLREPCPKEDIWHLSPFVFTELHRRVWRIVRRLEIDWQMLLIVAPVGLEAIRLAIGHQFGAHLLFYLESGSAWQTLLLMLATVLSIATPIRIWNNARIEHRLDEQQKLLMAARIEALAGQINPHFLFNTLASISSLIRSEPDKARMLIARLSSLLRRLLRSRDHFVTLKEELDSIDQYLDIEVVRFGPQLRVVKQVAPETLGAWVPNMILQPIVENSIKHGLTPKVGGGTIVIRSARTRGGTVIEVADDGIGMPEERLREALHDGIGLSNVNERLRVIYGDSHQLKLTSEHGRGSSVRFEIPDLADGGRPAG